MKPVVDFGYVHSLLDIFSVQNGLKQGDSLSLMFLKSDLEFAIREVQPMRED